MKKLLPIILILIIAIGITSSSFAAGETVDTKMYKKDKTTIIPNEKTPKAPVLVSENSDVLPKTGGIPAEAFYIVGAAIIVAGAIVSKKK